MFSMDTLAPNLNNQNIFKNPIMDYIKIFAKEFQGSKYRFFKIFFKGPAVLQPLTFKIIFLKTLRPHT